MAVGRITASKRWFNRMAAKAAHEPRISRELTRAADRYGRMAEFTGDEIRKLYSISRGDELVARALSEVDEAEERDRERLRQLRVRQASWPREQAR